MDQSTFERVATRRKFKAAEVIALQEAPSPFVGLVVAGQAQAICYSENGSQTWLGSFEAGAFFCHANILADRPSRFEIVAITNVEALVMPEAAFDALMREHAQLGHTISRGLAQRLDAVSVRLVEALTLTTKGRICAELVRLSSSAGHDDLRDIIRPNPVFTDVALRVNSTRETVSRTVSELQKKGLISRVPGALIIEQPSGLKGYVK